LNAHDFDPGSSLLARAKRTAAAVRDIANRQLRDAADSLLLVVDVDVETEVLGFGPLTHPPRVTIIEIPTGWGSQAHLIAGIILTAETFQGPKWLFELYHEVAHFWNPEANDSPSPRLNEGLATWMECVVSESLDQIPSDHGKRMSGQVLQRAASDARVQTVPLMAYGKENMTGWSYRVGDLYFHLLDAAIGREALRGVLRDWYQTHKTSGATLQDFTSLLESRYPKTKAIDDDWIRSTAWLAKLRESPSAEQLAAKY